MTGSCAVLLAASDAASPPAPTTAVFVTLTAVGATFAIIVIAFSADPEPATLGFVQETTCPATLHDQLVPEALTGVRPEGKVSVTAMGPLLASKPIFVTTKVNVTPF